MAAEDAIARAVARGERAVRNVLLSLARRLRLAIRELDTVDGRFVRDQAANVARLSAQVREDMQGAVPDIVREVVAELRAVLEDTIGDHPSLGAFDAEIAEDLQRLFAGVADEITATLVDGGSAEIASALERVIAGAEPISEAIGPVATALETTSSRAVTTIERGVREWHETALKGMGANSNLGEFGYRYVGPSAESPNIRPYCAARVGKVLTQAQADALDPTERWNCRHGLAPILLSEARRRGLEFFDG